MRLAFALTAPQRVFAAFAIYAFSMGNIFPRLGDVQLAMGVQEGALGLGLIGAPIGTLISLTFAAPILERIGVRRVLILGLPLLALLYAVAVQAPSPAALFVLLIPVGLIIGGIEIVLNVEADRAEHLVGYRIMNRSHAFWSIGFFAAGLFGALMATLGLSPQLHLGLVFPLAVLGVVLCLRDFVPAPKRAAESREPGPRFAAPTPAILLLVAVTLGSMLLEGASMDWSAIYMRDVFAAGPFLSGIAVASFAIAQAVSRFYADHFVERHSPVSVARFLQAVLMIGCLLVYFSPLSGLSLLGFAMMGMGTSAMFPLAMSAAAQRRDRPAAVNVAALAQLSFTMFLLGPPLLGFVAQHWGIRASFGIGLPLIVLSLLAAGSLATRPQGNAADNKA